jgi:peptidoglycan/LPS O-acetylase OafA/YrhL
MYSVLLLVFLVPDPEFSQMYCRNSNGSECPLADPLPSPTLRYYAAFIVGLILAEVRCTGYLDQPIINQAKAQFFSPARQELLRTLAKCAMLALALVVSGWYRLYDDGAIDVINGANADIVLVIGASCLVACVCVSPRMQHWLMKKPILYLGRISFALYLLHTTVIFSVVCAIVSAGLPYGAASALAVIAMSVVLLPLSHAFTVFVDERLAVKGVRAAYKRAHFCAMLQAKWRVAPVNQN